ncbi:metallo-beta-lactamase domain protein [Apiospora arundinis]|uniref:Metallo-beta-lactamase domain protein n=1 Tax=Apiospora arundinis TaxID=335852 RepID=A0ABR2HKA7_9PEZI
MRTPAPAIARKMAAAQLVPLPEVERLSPACLRILGGNPGKFSLQGTNTYLVGTGHRRLLIDTGHGKPSWIAALKRALDDEKVTIQSALLTHWHPDHVGGVVELLRHSPETKLYKRDRSQNVPLSEAAAGDWLDIEDGQVFEVEGATLRAVHTPGHTTDHMVFVLQEEDALFTGDNVLGHGTAVFEDLQTYLQSLGKMEGLVAGRGYPGHGAMLPEARTKIAEYIAHRHERENQVLEVLGSAKEGQDGSAAAAADDATNRIARAYSWTPMELVKVIYKAYPESLHGPACAGVVQILQKLWVEDKVVSDGDNEWRLQEDRSSQ